MSAKTIKSALGLLQDDPDHARAWRELREEVSGGHAGMERDELARLLEAARCAHQGRREAEAVAGLLALEIVLAQGTPGEVELVAERARVLDEDLLDDGAASVEYGRLLALRPGDPQPEEAIERGAAKRAKWPELVDRYLEEARGATDSTFRSSLLVSAAEVTYRYGRAGASRAAEPLERIWSLLREALDLDPKSRRAQMLLERELRDEGRWDDLAAAIERFTSESPQREEKVAALLRLARVCVKKLDAPERAAAAYERVLGLEPGRAEAASFLADHYTSRESWERLVALYEGQLQSSMGGADAGAAAGSVAEGAPAGGAARRGREELGAVLQIAMVHWRMRGAPEDAEPWFERVRKLDPAHPGMLAFFREWCPARGEGARLVTVLTAAARAVPEGPQRAAIAGEVAKLAEESDSAQKAIESWRAVLRQDPHHHDAREALKRLYRQTAGWNALADLLRQELDRVPADDRDARLALLREIADVYRTHLKSDSALVTVLTQIVHLDAGDLRSWRDLARVYETLQRWRDLLAAQVKQAELEPDPADKAQLWRSMARRWAAQFSNVQNATEAYEKLHALAPRDAEATDRLKELYLKRRAYRPLYDLLAEQAAEATEGPERRTLWADMARLAGERLEMGSQAAALYRRVLDEEPGAPGVLDALEKLGERDKDFPVVADALERRSMLADDDGARLLVLQKLGAVYSDRLHDGARAADTWRRVLTLQPGHPKALRVLRDGLLSRGDYDGLEELYGQNGDWEGLAEVFSGAADRTEDPQVKVDLSFRCAAIYTDRLDAPERAFRAYERVLSVVPDDARAAASLVPIYERDGQWGRLPALYQVLLASARTVEEKLALLERLVRVTGSELHDRAAAFVWARQAYELGPDREGALAAFEKAARSAGQWDGLVEAVRERIDGLEQPSGSIEAAVRAGTRKRRRKDNDGGLSRESREELRVLRAKLAQVYAGEMGRLDEAIATYRLLVEEDENDSETVLTLDRLLRENDRREDLRWLFGLRVARANTAHKLELLAEWATLEEGGFGAPDQAIALYRRVLDIVPQHGPALRALARLLQAQGDAQGAVEVLSLDRDQREGAERAAREVDIAKLLADPLRRYAESLAACERALLLSPDDARAVEAVEQLLLVPETRARAAALLDRAYEEAGAAAQHAVVLEVLIATTAARADRIALYERLADLCESKLGDADAAFDVMARAAGEFVPELALWDRLAILSAKTGRGQALVEAIVAAVPPVGPSGLPEHVELDLAERAATLFDERLGDPDRARPYLERMLSLQPGNERAFSRLKQILSTRERWGELEALYEQAIAATSDVSRRVELLAEVVLIAEEMTGDRPRAIACCERILAIDPRHEQAGRSLEALYTQERCWEKLTDLLERRLPGVPDDEGLALRQRVGELLFTKLGDAAGALAYLEPVLRESPAETRARLLVEKILEAPELRARAAMVLESVYQARDEVSDLVHVLEIQLELASDVDEARDLWRRIAELRDERLRDDAGALEAFARLVPLDPGDARARRKMLEIARRTGAHERVAGVLEAAAQAASPPVPRADILMDLAHLHEQTADGTSRAREVYRQVVQMAPDDASIALPSCRALERIYAAEDNPRALADILRAEVKLEDDAATRRELRGRLGELCESRLNDPQGAIEAWRARLDESSGDAGALEALDRLYLRTGHWQELVDVLRAREQGSADASERRALLLRIATTLADSLSDVDEAIATYGTIIEDFGADRLSLAALATLYEVSDRWVDLADTLESDLALAEDQADKLAIFARVGDVRRRKLGDPAGALRAYEQALAIDPSHAPSRGALEEMLKGEGARREAAAILRPLYEADGLYEPLLAVLEVEAEHADSVAERLATLAQAADVAEGPLRNPVRALAYAARGLREAAAEPELPRWLDRVERLAAAADRQEELLELLQSVAGDILDGELALEVTLRIADVARTLPNGAEIAKQYYARALELRGSERRALVALQAVYRETSEHPALLDILQRRAQLSDGEQERKELLFEQAALCDEKLGDVGAAIRVYESIVDTDLDQRAALALERLYAQAERWHDLVALYERQLSARHVAEERKAFLHDALGDVLAQRLGDTEGAFDQYAAALEIDPEHPQTMASLEALMATEEHGARAAEMLEPVYLARLDWRRLMVALEARLRASKEPAERRELLRRLAKMHEEQEENYGAALETAAKLLAEDVADESTWGELERLARVANGEGRLAQIYAGELAKVATDGPATARLAQRTAELFEEQRDIERALVFYRRARAFGPGGKDGTFDAIDRLLRESGRAAERVSLHRETLESCSEPRERIGALHTIAMILEVEVCDDDAAIEAYRTALDVDDDDVRALEGLSRLYTRRGRWRDLADLSRRRAEQSALHDDEARFRLELAKLQLGPLEEPQAGIDELQSVVALSPPDVPGPGAEAVRALEGLLERPEHKARAVEILRPIYEHADDWRGLVALNGERVTLASSDSEKIAALRESARLWEGRGGDCARAFEAMRQAWTLDPEDGEVRAELERLAEATARWDEIVESYEAALPRTGRGTQRDVLGALAKVHDRRRDDPRRALEAWERRLLLDETDAAPLDEMDALATLLSDWSSLVRVLTRKAQLSTDGATRASLWRRVGEAQRDMLEDVDGAIEAYERALDIEPASPLTLDELIALYERRNDASRLVELYRRRVALCGEGDDALRFRLLVEAAARFEGALADRGQAIKCLSQALAVRPESIDVLRRLDALYLRERLWPELLDNLKRQAAAATDDPTRLKLKKRMAALYARELKNAPAALQAYREVLAAGGFDAEVTSAVLELGEANEDVRQEAAEVLEPVLCAAGRHADRVVALELRLRAQGERAERARTLRTLAQVAEGAMSDPERALSALLRALVEEPREHELHVEIERLAAVAGIEGWRRYANALQEHASTFFDAEVGADLFVRLGRVCERELDDPQRAANAYAAAAERMGDDPAVLAALDRLLSMLGQGRRLAEVLERRVATESDARTQADLLHRLGTLQIHELHAVSQGLATLKLALERAPEHRPSREALERLLDDDPHFEEAFEALEGALRALGAHADLAKLYGRRVQRALTVPERTRARLELARVLEALAQDPKGAQRVVEEAVADDPSDPAVLSELERLAERTAGWAGAADALAAAIESSPDAPAGMRTELWGRLAAWRRDKLGDWPRAEEAYSKALAIDPESLDVLRALEEIRRSPGRERDLVHTLRARARLEMDPALKRRLRREAKAVAQGGAGDHELAEAVLREMVAEDEGDLWALEELTKLRSVAGDDSEVVKLLLHRAEVVTARAEASALEHQAARVLVEGLHDGARAALLYERILESDPADPRAAQALRVLYSEAGRDEDLVRLLRRLIEVASTPEQRASLRLELARMQRERLGAIEDAIETLAAILDEDPMHAEAVRQLSELYEQSGRDADLAELLKMQVDGAKRSGDADARVRWLTALGEVQDGRLGDLAAAQGTYQDVLSHDPTHRRALEALARIGEKRSDWAGATAALGALVELSTDGAGVGFALRLAEARDKAGDAEGVEVALQRGLAFEPANHGLRAMLRMRWQKTEKWAPLAELLVGDAELLGAAHPDAAPSLPSRDSAPPAQSPALGGLQGSAKQKPAGHSARGRSSSIPPPPEVAPPVAEQVKLLRAAAEIHLVRRKSPDDAIGVLERAVALAPGDRETLLALCDAYSAAQRGRDAAQMLEAVIASFGSRRTKELAFYHHRLARALTQLGDKDVALTQLDMAFKIDPGSVGVLRDLGVLALEAGDLERAQKTFRALLLQRLDANAGISKGEVFYYLGEISAKQGDKAKAAQMFERAIENDPTLTQARAKLQALKA